MLRQPRRSPQICRFKFATTYNIKQTTSSNVCLQTVRETRIFWYNFESLRLHLTWTMTRRRRLSKKMFFKQKKKKKADVKQYFHSKNLKKSITRHIWFNGFPHLPYTTKPKGSRMGKGKGSLKAYFFKTSANHPLIFIKRCSPAQLCLLKYKLTKHIPGTSLALINNTHQTIIWN